MVNPQDFLLGLRFKPIDSPEERKGFLFATIGKGHDFPSKSLGILTAFLENKETQNKSAQKAFRYWTGADFRSS